MKKYKLVFTGVTALVVFLFVGIINPDDEFGESARFFLKLPPDYEFYFQRPPFGIEEAAHPVQFKMVSEYDKRERSYEKMGAAGEVTAFLLFELLLISIFIRPVFSNKPKFILLDLVLFITAAFMTQMCLAAWNVTPAGLMPCLIVTLLAHYILVRLARPADKYRGSTLQNLTPGEE